MAMSLGMKRPTHGPYSEPIGPNKGERSFRHADVSEAAPLIRARYLFVVSRQHSALYELLVERFQDDKNVEVIVDRRATRRRSAEQYEADDRRRRPQNELSVRSHFIVTRTEPASSSAMPE